jgi:hypothetical protein
LTFLPFSSASANVVTITVVVVVIFLLPLPGASLPLSLRTPRPLLNRFMIPLFICFITEREARHHHLRMW